MLYYKYDTMRIVIWTERGGEREREKHENMNHEVVFPIHIRPDTLNTVRAPDVHAVGMEFVIVIMCAREI